ncbi:MAG: dihydrofolate reductase [Candidatus Zapsychrus exili]|nr:dihydrofolate reductase [Candidatus Zapsychrus exili]
MRPLNIIVAVDKNFGIGKDGILPWHLLADLKHFKEITTNIDGAGKKNVVIMGRKTWDSLPDKFKPLANRVNVVLTRNKDLELPCGVIKAENLDIALELIEKISDCKIDRVFVIGGTECYEAALSNNILDKFYITHIEQDFICDTFFPVKKEDLEKDYERLSFTSMHEENDAVFYFAEYRKL